MTNNEIFIILISGIIAFIILLALFLRLDNKVKP